MSVAGKIKSLNECEVVDGKLKEKCPMFAPLCIKNLWWYFEVANKQEGRLEKVGGNFTSETTNSNSRFIILNFRLATTLKPDIDAKDDAK
jgi:hypothetical protein